MASDYSPPRLVKPTPGGNPGDGSVDGTITVRAGVNLRTTATNLILGGTTPNVYSISTDGSGDVLHQWIGVTGFFIRANGNFGLQNNFELGASVGNKDVGGDGYGVFVLDGDVDLERTSRPGGERGYRCPG